MNNGLSPRARVAVGAVRSVNWLSRVTRRGAGTVAGGRVGLTICPDLLAQLAKDRLVIVVSGTNGKTTTTAMTVAGWGGHVTTNETGSNMPAGHVAALASSSSPQVVLEADEGWLPEVVRRTQPRIVILLNLSRDQLDRANEVRKTAERWRTCLSEHQDKNLVVVANANDPLVVHAALEAKNVRWCDIPTPWHEDAKSCPHCTLALDYSDYSWSSPCGFSKPTAITTVLRDTLTIGTMHVALDLQLPGAFNEGNAAMALSALAELGIDPSESVSRVNKVRGVAGRFALRQWGAHRMRLLLAKNPAGFAAILSTIPQDPIDVWIAINARVADGHDPSWLYDVAFEQLRGHRVMCLGDRRLDLATRLDYADVDFQVVDDEATLESSDEPISLVANYTAFSDWLARSVPC